MTVDRPQDADAVLILTHQGAETTQEVDDGNV